MSIELSEVLEVDIPKALVLSTSVVGNIVTLNWVYHSKTPHNFTIYRSETEFDLDNLPNPLATVNDDVFTYVDSSGGYETEYYYLIEAEVVSNIELVETGEYVVVGDPHWNNVILMMHMDNNTTDSSGKASPPPTVRDETYFVSAPSPFNYAFNSNIGTTAFSNVSSNTWLLRNSSFTLEFRVFIHSLDKIETPIGKLTSDGSGGWEVRLVPSPNRVTFQRPSSGWTVDGDGYKTELPIGEWVHIAICRFSNNTAKIFINGVEHANFTSAGTGAVNISYVSIGKSNQTGSDRNYTGYIDEVRITNNVARYSSPFTPPSHPHPNHGLI